MVRAPLYVRILTIAEVRRWNEDLVLVFDKNAETRVSMAKTSAKARKMYHTPTTRVATRWKRALDNVTVPWSFLVHNVNKIIAAFVVRATKYIYLFCVFTMIKKSSGFPHQFREVFTYITILVIT